MSDDGFTSNELRQPHRSKLVFNFVQVVAKKEDPVTAQPTSRSVRPRLSELSSFHRTKLVFLAAAFISFLLSVGLWFSGDRELGIFVGLWVPAIHSLGTLVLTGEDA